MEVGVAVRAARQFGVIAISMRPCRFLERLRGIAAAGLENAAHPHRAAVGGFGTDGFAEFAARFAPDPEIGSGQRREHRVARTVGEKFRRDGDLLLGGGLPAGHGFNAVSRHDSGAAGTVVEHLKVRFGFERAPQHHVPDGIAAVGVDPAVFQPEFFEDAGFAQVGQLAEPVGSGNLHPAFAGGVAARHRAVVHQHHPEAGAGAFKRHRHTRDAAADHTEVGTDRLFRKRGIHNSLHKLDQQRILPQTEMVDEQIAGSLPADSGGKPVFGL